MSRRSAQNLVYSVSETQKLQIGKNIDLNRKVLADMAMNHPQTFEQIVKAAS